MSPAIMHSGKLLVVYIIEPVTLTSISALASLENEGPSSNPASPPSQMSQPNIERARSKSPAATKG